MRPKLRHVRLLHGALALCAAAACPVAMALAISGTPANSVVAGTTYSFSPAISGATSGKTLAFRIANKPVWATFSIITGRLTGTPTTAEAGPYNNIEIYCSDGQTLAHTASFNITVLPRVGHARLYWTVPTENTDGTELTDLAGYRVYYGRSPADLSNIIQVPEPWVSAVTIEKLAASTWYFGITAYTTSGLESSMSPIVSKSVD